MPYVYEVVTAPAKRPWRLRILVWTIFSLFIICLGIAVYPLLPAVAYTANDISPIPLPAKQKAQQVAKEAALPEPPAANDRDTLFIPKIGVKTHILQGKSLDILNHNEGVWNQVGQPDQGNFVIAGHRFQYLPPNTTTFYNLDKMEIGDQIVVWWQKQRFAYTVTKKFIVKPTAVEIIAPTTFRQLTIYTCEDIYAHHRLVIQALPNESR